MSTERQIDRGVRHAEARATLPWSMAAPDEALMAREDAAGDGAADGSSGWGAQGKRVDRAELWERLLGFLFADGQPECWECVALRGLSLIRHCAPSLLAGRDLSGVPGIRERAGRRVQPSFRLTGFVEACEGEEGMRETLRVMLGFVFGIGIGSGLGTGSATECGGAGTEGAAGMGGLASKRAGGPRSQGGAEGSEWLVEGCRRAYLLARGYQPELVRVVKEVGVRVKVPVPVAVPGRPGQVQMRVRLELRQEPRLVEMSYEDMARVFGELREDGAGAGGGGGERRKGKTTEGKRARARWSARAQKLIVRPIEANGGTVHLQFGKSASTREKCRERARGNSNRRGGGGASGGGEP